MDEANKQLPILLRDFHYIAFDGTDEEYNEQYREWQQERQQALDEIRYQESPHYQERLKLTDWLLGWHPLHETSSICLSSLHHEIWQECWDIADKALTGVDCDDKKAVKDEYKPALEHLDIRRIVESGKSIEQLTEQYRASNSISKAHKACDIAKYTTEPATDTRTRKQRQQRAKRQAREMVSWLLGNRQIVSHFTKDSRQRQNEANKKWLTKRDLKNTTTGKRVSLAEVARTKEKVVAEYTALIKGIEQEAEGKQLRGLFLTATLPPEYHINPSRGRNSWRGYTPNHGWQRLMRGWQRVRARLKRRNIKLYGIRVPEPHKDGTPHLHALTFNTGEDIEIISQYWRDEFGGEPATKIVEINNNIARASSYVGKYVRKSINDDPVDAWRATWGMRACQFVGLPTGLISAWREFRRISETPTESNPATLWRMARGGRGADFIRLWRLQHNEYEWITEPRQEVNPYTGEIIEKGERVIGIHHTPTGWHTITHYGYWEQCPSERELQLSQIIQEVQRGPPLLGIRLEQLLRRNIATNQKIGDFSNATEVA